MKRELCIKSICLAIITTFVFTAIVMADYLTADPQPKEVVTKYQIKLNGEVIPVDLEQVGADQVRLFYNIDHLTTGKYSAFAMAGDDSGEWSPWSEELIFYRGVPTPQNIGLYCVTEEPKRIPQDTLSLYHFSSEELVAQNRPASNILDGRTGTIWSASFNEVHPHELQIYLGRTYQVSGVYVLPRQDAGTWGAIKDYEIYVSTDGMDWINVKVGVLPIDKEEQLVKFEAVTAKYISLVCLSEHSGGTRNSMSEINVLGY